MNEKETFNKQDRIDICDLMDAKFKNVLDIINANDKNYNQRFDNVIEATKSALASSDRAVNKAEGAAEKRFEGLNELRGMALDQQRNYMPRAEVEIMIKGINEKIDSLTNTNLLKTGQKEGMGASWGIIVGGVAFIAAVIALLLNAIRLFNLSD